MNRSALRNKTFSGLLLLLSLATANPASALNVFACEPEWGALVEVLAGELAQVTVATTAFQDPHRLQARPSLIASARNADLLVCTGADLEVGWLPPLLLRSGNSNIQPGRPGNFLAADFVRRIDIPVRLDRAQGDVHPQGNPHIHLNPNNLTRIAQALTLRLQQLDPANARAYETRANDFLDRWVAAIEGWEIRGEMLAGMRLVAHHTSFSYLADWLDLDIVATLEAKPGIPPSAAHLAALLEQLQPAPPEAIIRSPYDNEKPSTWLSQRLDVPAMLLPYTIGGADSVTNLFELFEVTLTRLEALVL